MAYEKNSIRKNFAARVFLVVCVLCLITNCGDDESDLYSWPSPFYIDQLIPEIQSTNGGLQSNYPATGSVYYYNYIHTPEESDISMDASIRGSQTARRYLLVSGKAIPDDSGFTDRFYHSVSFAIVASNGAASYITIPVDATNFFKGYLYFREIGTNNVYAFRAQNDTLYPRRGKGTVHVVQENYSTLFFQVIVQEAVPSSYTNLIPTSQVNSGNQAVREYAQKIISIAGAVTDREKVNAVYDFLIDGDAAGRFVYTYYDQIYPGYLSLSWNSIFIASHFLKRRVGVCNDFAELFAALVRSLGIPVKKVSGVDPFTGGGHMWNSVYFESQWWWLDATWANGVPLARYRYAQWIAPSDWQIVFPNEHDNTYTDYFRNEY